MTDASDAAQRRHAMTMLEQHVTVSMQTERLDEGALRERLRRFNVIVDPVLTEAELETVARRLGERLAIDVDLGSVITSRDHAPWLEARKRDNGIDWGRWLAYKQMLIQQQRPLKVIDTTDELTDTILDLAGDPTRLGAWARRGLVLGDVQSGKTGTYLGLFNKAADAGYRLIILLAGNTEVLRQQTQARVDEAFIGRDSSTAAPRRGVNVTQSKYIGVGLIRRDLAQASGMTTVLQDFRRSSQEATNITIQTNASHPYVFVIKKNKQILRSNTRGEDSGLYLWLKEQAHDSGGRLAIPVLVLDDESDYASVNTRTENDPTAINNAIRDLLALFTRSSYIAFTATPFANIFIDHGIENDLFPRDYVYSLEAPTNYVGSVRTFGTTESVRADGLVSLEDVESLIPLGHKSGLRVTALPASLTDAVDTFLLSNAIRDLRGDADRPRAMLVNVSRFKAVQRQVYELLADVVGETRNAIELHHADTSTRHSVIGRLKDRFTKTYADAGVRWPEVLRSLPAAVSDVRVRLFNSDTDKRMSEEDIAWERPARMVAVGGDVLSRGLTLEGLCVSYFYRRVTASDTLMQMARWFGYRDGYEDLCRIWINADSADNYRFAADAIEELRTDLRLMLRQNLTPEDFGLAVRKHPGALLITARNKMKSAAEQTRVISLAGRRLETTSLLRDHGRNRADLAWLIDALEQDAEYRLTRAGWHRWLAADRAIIAEYLVRYGGNSRREDPFFGGSTLSTWARTARAEHLRSWDVAIANGRRDAPTVMLGTGRELRLPQRNIRRDGEELRVSGSSRRLGGPTDLAQMLEPADRAAAEAEFNDQEPDKALTERIYYPRLARPALIIYPLVSEPGDGEADADTQNHEHIDASAYVVALKVAIPGDPTRVRDRSGDVTYVINTVAQQNWLSEFTDSDDADVDD